LHIVTHCTRQFMLLLGLLAIGACASAGARSGELLAGDTGERICGDSTLFIHSLGPNMIFQEGMLLAPDSIHWSRISPATELRLSAPIDHMLVIREAVTRYRYSDDSLLKTWTATNGRLEIRGDSAMYAYGDKAARVQRGPIANDAAVMLSRSAAFDEILIRRARMTGRDSMDIPTFFLGEPGFTPTAHVRFIRADSAQIRFGNNDIVAKMAVDSVGRILSETYQARGDDVVTVRRGRCSK
jgi:hypothetical protein